MNLVNLLLILASVGLSALAQIAMKSGMSAPTVLAAVEQGSVAASYVSILTTPMVWVGLGCYGLGALVWLRVLSAVDVGQAYPFVALGFVLTMALGCLVLGEAVHLTRLFGAGLILAGVWLVGLR